jgi:adenylate kinase
MNTSFQEVDHVIKTFKTHEYQEEKVLVLISSVMSWANTPPKIQKEQDEEDEEQKEENEDSAEDEEEDPDDIEEDEAEGDEQAEQQPEDEDAEPKPVVLRFREKDFHQRVPSRRFQYLKTLETLALSSIKSQPKLRVYVLCAGLLYGSGERILHDHFKQSWLQNPTQLQYVGEGKNLVPTIHVKDLARLVRKIVTKRPDRYYVFALDKTKNPTQKRIVSSIAKSMGTNQTASVAFDDVKQHEWAEFLTLDLKMKASSILKDDEPSPEAEDPEEEAKAGMFPWHCQKGITRNVLMLNNEFNDYRGLKPVKILITGPPACGKSHYAALLAKYYNIPHISIQDALAIIPKIKGEFGDEVRDFIEAKKDADMEAFEDKEDKKKGETLNRDKIIVRLPEKYIYKIMKMKLSENACRNRGYILDGYPRTFKDSQYIFLKRVFKQTTNEEGDIEVEEGEENDELEEDTVDDDGVWTKKLFEKYEPDEHLVPDSILLLDGGAEIIKKRVKELPESKIEGTHWNNKDLDRRNKQYNLVNNSPIGDPSLADFFAKWEVGLMKDNCMHEENKLTESFKIFIERNGKPNNYMTFDQESENKRIAKVEEQSKARNITEAERVEREEYVERQWRKQKEEYTKTKFEQIKEQERELLDSKSQPIRAYLVDNMVPILTDGLIEVCKTQPEDPVDFLAEFLFRESKNVQPNNINFY